MTSVARALLSAGAVLGIMAMAAQQVRSVVRDSWESRRHALELDRVRVIRDSQSVFPLVEITLRNPAPSTSFLKEIDVDVRRRSARTRASACRDSARAGEYNLLLDPGRSLERRRLALSQLVDPHSSHRFAIILGQGALRGLSAHAEYDLAATILYNEDGALPLETISVAIDGPPCATSPTVADATPVTRVRRSPLPRPR